jgi:large subunit ribosomal protein L1
MIIGKKSFPVEDLADNYVAVLDEVQRAKPASSKGRYLKAIAISTTMGPGIRIDPTKSKDLVEEEMESAPA